MVVQLMEGNCQRNKWKFKTKVIVPIVVLLSLLVTAQLATAYNVILVMDDDDGKYDNEGEELSSLPSSEGSGGLSSGLDSADSNEWDEFGDMDDLRDEDLDPGSWRQALEKEQAEGGSNRDDVQYARGVREMIDGIGDGDPVVLKEALQDLKVAADRGHPHAQSTLGFLHGSGYGMDKDDAKAFLYHHFAAEGGNFQSKMALAYTYSRQQVHDKAVKLYAELAATAMASFMSSKDGPVTEPVRLNDGSEESKEFKKFRGEDDDDFQFLEYKARKGFSLAMHRLGLIYYYGLRGVPRNHEKALNWFIKAVEKGDYESMELLGESYGRGYGVPRNYTKAYEWFLQATSAGQNSAYNGLGWLYAKGLGVEKRNLTKARELFKKAADANDPNGHYNLGVLYLKGTGIKRNVKEARIHFLHALTITKMNHAKSLFQLAKMRQKGIGMAKDEALAVKLYKLVAERGPWGSLLKWGLECYINRDIGKALVLYSRAAELGYEVAQSNAAWILDKYYSEDVCIGSSGVCTDKERHQRAHDLWRHASEQGNQHAALLIGDAYYYGRGTKKDLDRAADAYNRAQWQRNAQAMFNLGYMHEHGLGLPMDLHLAKRYYDQALETDHDALLPVTLALTGLWLRQHYSNSILVKMIDTSPEAISKAGKWVRELTLDEGNVTLATLFVCLLTVLYLRQRHRRVAVVQPPPEPLPVPAPAPQ